MSVPRGSGSFVTCPGCGLVHPDRALPLVPERRMTGECASEASQATAIFYDHDLMAARQFIVDALACQHPDPTSRRGVQTTALCLMTMDLYLECGQPVEHGSVMHQEMMRNHPKIFIELEPPDLTEALTYRHLDTAPTRHEYASRAAEWARSVWDAWAGHHEQVRAWNLQLVPHRVHSR
jgi:uncharacterized Zn-finger protein